MPQSQKSLTQRDVKDVWTHDDSFATTLLLLFVDTYGTEGFTWDPRTIKMEIQDDFNVKLPSANFSRLMTAISLVTSDSFYKSLPDFVTFCNILSGDDFDPRTWEPADASEVAWGITEAMLICPPEEDEPFTPDILAYIGAILDMEGIMTPPGILRIAIREKDLAATVQSDFSDDPTMFSAVYQFESSKTEIINQTVKANLAELSNQLDALHLTSGETRGIVQQMIRVLH